VIAPPFTTETARRKVQAAEDLWKWTRELDYRLRKTLWGFHGNRMAVSFEYEWHDDSGQWFRSYGAELWEFDDDGLMRRRVASINDAPIAHAERRILTDR
jgi:uncharacterized protein